MGGAEEALTVHIVRRWTDALMGKRWTFRRVFAGAAEGLMKLAEFRAQIIGAGVFVKSEEWRLIVRKYGGNPAGDIEWARFVADTEKRTVF
jgi:hypothetical protein